MNDNALLIYSTEDIEKNKWFIHRLTEKSACFGVELKLMTVEECRDAYVDADAVTDNMPAFVINRSRAADISEWFEKRNIFSFNNSETVRIGNDKYAEYELFKNMDLPVMETVAMEPAWESIPFGVPYIVKKRNGHGGSGVFMADSLDRVKEITAGSSPDEWIIQKMCDEPGADMRLYLLGGKVIASVLRSSDRDFRSNFSLGGKAVLTEAPEDVRKNAEEIARRLKADYIAVDLIRNGGQWVYNEIEDAAGARMLYELTDMDIGGRFISFIYEKTFQKTENGIK